MRFLIFSLTLVAGLLILAHQSRADFIINGSFEMGTNPPAGGSVSYLGAGSTNLTGWTISGGDQYEGMAWFSNGNSYGLTTPFGNNAVNLNGFSYEPYYTVSQMINTAVGQQYSLTFDLGVDNPQYPGPNVLLAQAGLTSQSFTDNPVATGNIWTEFTMNFTATSTSTLISLGATQITTNYFGLDNVSVITFSSAVPEPSSIALVSIGLAAALARFLRRHFRKSSGLAAPMI